MPLPPPPLVAAPQVANVLTAVVLSLGLVFTYLLAYGLPHLAAYLPPLLYCGLLGLLLFPGGVLHRDARLFFGQTLWRVATPIRPVAWSDFLLADVLTSLAKAISDTERAVCHIMVGPIMEPGVQVRQLRGDVAWGWERSGAAGMGGGGDSRLAPRASPSFRAPWPHAPPAARSPSRPPLPQACSDVSLLLPLGLAAPYAWRLVQCLRVYMDTGARPQLLNALKYSTAFPVRAPTGVGACKDALPCPALAASSGPCAWARRGRRSGEQAGRQAGRRARLACCTCSGSHPPPPLHTRPPARCPPGHRAVVCQIPRAPHRLGGLLEAAVAGLGAAQQRLLLLLGRGARLGDLLVQPDGCASELEGSSRARVLSGGCWAPRASFVGGLRWGL